MKLEPMLAIFSLGGTEIILILAIALLLFGGKKLPELAKGLGQGIREFKKATKAVTDEVQNTAEEKPARKFLTNSRSQPAQTVSQSPNPSKALRQFFCMAGDHETEGSDEAQNGPVKTFLEHLEDCHMKKTIQCAPWISGEFVPKIIFDLPGINPVRARSGELNKLKTYAKRQQKTKHQTGSSFDGGCSQP